MDETVDIVWIFII